jgi:hypothetical protein
MSYLISKSGRILARAVLAIVFFSFAVAACAETWQLTLKQLGKPDASAANSDMLLYYGRSDQSFQSQVGPAGKDRIEWPGMEEQAAEFKRIVKKEPGYKSDYPFRAVAELGGKKFAFALDAVPVDAKAETKTDVKATEKGEDANSENKETKSTPKTKIPAYNRLYFDFNGNGDLTDDKVVEAEPATSDEQGAQWGEGWTTYEFPRVEVPLDVNGVKYTFACSISGFLQQNEGVRYASASLTATDYREGEITLDGKKLRVVLFDSNCDGRFDDAASVATNGRQDESLNLIEGDSLLIKAAEENQPPATRIDLLRAQYDEARTRICKLTQIDGRYYEMTIPPSGGTISLEAVKVETGKITNPNDGFKAVIYGEQGILSIEGGKDAAVDVPVGRWKLMRYKIDRTKIEEAEEKAKSAEAKDGPQKQSILQALSKSIAGVGGALTASKPRRETYVQAEATAAYREVEVRKGETIAMPFGPPYKPQVSVGGFLDKEKKIVRLSLSLVGSAGEVCSDLEVKGGRPAKPEFTITDPDGKEVVKGAFEYG